MWFRGSILAAAGILVRIIGMLYRMPLNDIIGKQGNGYYTSAYNVYNILLILSSYSMPVAVSKMISSRLARGEYHNCRRILKAALCTPRRQEELPPLSSGSVRICSRS